MIDGIIRKRHMAGLFFLLSILFLAACQAQGSPVPAVGNEGAAGSDAAAPTMTTVESVTDSDVSQNNLAGSQAAGIDNENSAENDELNRDQATSASAPTAEPTLANTPTATPQPATATPVILIEDGVYLVDDRPEHLRQATVGWNTNWERHTVEYEDFLSGGPPRDGIRSLDEPEFVSIENASAWLAGNEPVIALEVDGEARAYPLQILTWHEIVNDSIGELPVIVTFCPLCNSAIVFDRQLDGETYEFGTSGLLRNSDLVMYDRTTETLWQQFTGEAIVGDLVGKQLNFLPSSLVSFTDFREAFPMGTVLSQATGFDRPYGVNPYAGYDTYQSSLSQGGNIALLKQEQDHRLPAAERVVTLSLEKSGIDVAYPLTFLSEVSIINDRQAEQDIVVFFSPGASSALGAQIIAIAEDVGATGVFDPNLEGQKLTFSLVEDRIVDDQTQSTWNIFGQATSGELAGSELEPIVHGDHFWFSWAAFKPNTLIYQDNS